MVPDLSKSLSLSQKKVWNPEEVVILRNTFKEELENNKVKLEVAREKLPGDKTFKLKKLLLINTVASTVSYLSCFSFFQNAKQFGKFRKDIHIHVVIILDKR